MQYAQIHRAISYVVVNQILQEIHIKVALISMNVLRLSNRVHPVRFAKILAPAIIVVVHKDLLRNPIRKLHANKSM